MQDYNIHEDVEQEEEDPEVQRLMEWAEYGRGGEDGIEDETGTAKSDSIGFCSSDILDDRVGLPSAEIPDDDVSDPNLLADREEIECGCSVDEECNECRSVKQAAKQNLS